MDILIHDVNDQESKRVFHDISKNAHIISDTGSIKNCVGCFGCWIKTPGKCVIKDGYENLGEIFSRADNIIVVSECFYGGYSPFVKNILDRSISYLLPFFKIWNNEMHHQKRYKNNFKFISYFVVNPKC